MASRRTIGFLFCLFLVAMSPVLGHQDSSHVTETPEEMLEIDELEVIEVDDVSTPSQPDFLGSLHPAVIHFPIAWVTLLFLVELVGLITRRSAWHQAGLYLLFLAVVSFFPAVMTGLLKYGQTTYTGEYDEIAQLHRNLNLFAAGLTVLALLLRVKLKTNNNKLHRLVYVATVAVAAGLVLFSSHLGGLLVHG